MEAEKRGLSDYNGEMRRGGRGGGGYRMPSSKDMGSEMGPYGEKVSFFYMGNLEKGTAFTTLATQVKDSNHSCPFSVFCSANKENVQ